MCPSIYVWCWVSKLVAWAALSARTRAPRSKFRQIWPNFAHGRTDGATRTPRRIQTDPQRVRDGLGIVYNLLGHPGTSHRALYHLFTPQYCSRPHFAKISRDIEGYPCLLRRVRTLVRAPSQLVGVREFVEIVMKSPVTKKCEFIKACRIFRSQ